jgi:hypothetical protein
MLLAAAAALVFTGVSLAAPAPVAAPTPVTVARYSFDSGLTASRTIPDLSGRGLPLRVRSADGGAITFVARGTGKAVAFPARCSATATRCPRVILEGGDDADLDPGTRPFRFGAYVRSTLAQVGAGANVMQKGVATTASQWKMQIGRQGRPSCVVVGQGSKRIYLARASVTVTNNAWHQITCRRAGSTLSIYVDNVLRGSVAVPTSVSIANTLPLRLGGRNLGTRADQFGGAIDEAYVALG